MIIEINNELYIKKPEKQYKPNSILMALSLLNNNYNIGFAEKVVISDNELINEFELIQQKKSKLSRRQRDNIEHRFYNFFKHIKINSMKLNEAQQIAETIKTELAPHCHRIEIAGSIRRLKPEVKDIEIVAIPKPYDIGLFASGVAQVVNQWPKVKGELPCKYTQRVLPQGIKLDLFFATPQNWGLIFAIRTGSAEYSHKVLATEWVKRGYKSDGGMLYFNGNPVAVKEETDLFKMLRMKFVEPWERNL